MANVEPRTHNSMSRFGAAASDGAGRGFRWGIAGAALGALVVPAIGISIAAGVTSLFVAGGFMSGLATLGTWGAITVGAVTGIAAAPFTVGATGIGAAIGGALGLDTGARNANLRTSSEHEAARYVNSYNQTKSQLQQMAVAQYAEPATPIFAANDNPFHQAANQIDAGTAAHQQTVAAQNIEQARV